MVGCEAELTERTGNPTGQELSFAATVEDSATRVENTVWGNDMIGVFMVDETDGTVLAGNKRFHTIANGIFNAYTSSDRIVLSEGATVGLYAYYPHNTNTENFAVPVDIADQSDQSRLDFMQAKVGDVSVFTPAPTFTFTRQTVRLVFEVAAGKGITSLGGLTATISGVPTRATFDVRSGVMTIDRSSAVPFNANVEIEGANARVEATIFADTQDVPTVTFTLGGSPFIWHVEGAFGDKGWRHTYNVTITDRNGGSVVPDNKYFDPPVLPSGGAPAIPPAGATAGKYITFADSGLIYYEVDFPDRPGRNYQMLYDTKERVAHWVAYPMYESIMGSGNRTDAYNTFDPNVPHEQQQTLARGYGGGYDRGHMMPSADRNYNTTVNRITFYNTNMTPQISSMNQGIWNQLEGAVRTWARQCDTLYVVTGMALTTSESQTISHVNDNNGKSVGVPKYYYKALAKRHNATGTFHTVAYKIDNRNIGHSRYNDFRISVTELERATGYTFFPQLPDPSIKNTVDVTQW